MIGPAEVTARLTAWIAAAVPGRLTIIRDRETYTAADVPNVGGFLGGEPHRDDSVTHPIVFVAPRTLDGIRHDPSDDTWSAVYRVRFYVFARGQEYDDTALSRDATLLAVREAVLLDTGAAQGGGFAVDPSTMREEYADVGVDEGGRSILAAYLEVAVTVVEELAIPALGTADDVFVEPEVLPHPALE